MAVDPKNNKDIIIEKATKYTVKKLENEFRVTFIELNITSFLKHKNRQIVQTQMEFVHSAIMKMFANLQSLLVFHATF